MSTEQKLARYAVPGSRLRGVAPPAAWVVLLAAIPFLAGFYLLLPPTGLSRTIAYPAFGIIGMLAILLGVHMRRPARSGSWRLIAVALALLAFGDIVYSFLSGDGQEVAYPSPADIAYLGGYVVLIAGIASLIRGRVAGGDRTALIDAAILAAGAGSIVWFAVIQPGLAGTVEPMVGVVSMAYPVMDLILLGLGLRVLLTAARPRYLQFLLAGVAIYFFADLVYALLLLNQAYGDANPVDAGWIVGILLIGVAALHPSVADPVTTVESSDARLSGSRLATLAAAALIAPTILVIHEIQAGDDLVVGLVLEWTLLFGLVLVRLGITVRELGATLQQRRHLQVDLAHQAHHDPLTQLANRSLFEVRLAQAMATAPETTALIFLDLDDFKTINDTLGHATGDELLRVLAGRVQRGLRATDLAARLGGDEFAILVEACQGPSMALAVAERALAVLRAPLSLVDRQLEVHASAGVAMGHARSTPTDLMRDADVAMYQAKAHGKNRVEAYVAAMHGEVIRSYELGTELAHAIETGAFVLHFQPAVNLTSGAIVGAEALVRWNHPQRGLLGPHEFIPQAESSGLIHSLGRWILREACFAAVGWPTRLDGQRPAVSVNLAASQLLQPGIVEEVAEILAETGLPPRKLILEVTESALVDLDVARAALLRLRGLGVLLALDDFGTGYSALSYLARLPFDIVKIDQSFVAAIGQGRRVDALLAGILGLCDALELVTVAEGIEEGPQLDRLVALGCRIGQGYLFARPVPAAEFTALLTTSRETQRQSPGVGAFTALVARPVVAAAV
ncbi:MAG TPA: EAL domain-containing protein [Candidatus Limnocylindrales bacterium]